MEPPSKGGRGGTVDERALVERLKARDPAAFEQLLRRSGAQLLAVARRHAQGEEQARECVQEAMLQAWRKIDSFRGDGALEAWLTRIVINQVRMARRRSKSAEEESIDELLPQFDERLCRTDQVDQLPAPADRLLERKEVRETVRAHIASLPEIYRDVLMLRDIEGFDGRETAAILEISEAAVRVRLHRARAALKKLLEPLLYGETPP